MPPHEESQNTSCILLLLLLCPALAFIAVQGSPLVFNNPHLYRKEIPLILTVSSNLDAPPSTLKLAPYNAPCSSTVRSRGISTPRTLGLPFVLLDSPSKSFPDCLCLHTSFFSFRNYGEGPAFVNPRSDSTYTFPPLPMCQYNTLFQGDWD